MQGTCHSHKSYITVVMLSKCLYIWQSDITTTASLWCDTPFNGKMRCYLTQIQQTQEAVQQYTRMDLP